MPKCKLSIVLTVLILAALACGTETNPSIQSDPSQQAAQPQEISTQPVVTPITELESTVFGFFPSPPEASFEAIISHFQLLGQHADFILMQREVPWKDFVDGTEGESQQRTDIENLTILTEQNGMDRIFVVDPLNGLNRREFFGLPDTWEASFANPDVRAAITNFTIWIVQEYQPHYLGLASEINTYADAHPDDFPHYVSLYKEIYDLVKTEAPDTQVFVTFQWDDLNNVLPEISEGRAAFDTNWDQIEIFEPQLDIWAISSYPYVFFPSMSEVPGDYYSRLLDRTDKPLAVAEGGYSSRQIGPFTGTEQDQVDYLNAIHTQIGERLDFWVYLVLSDFNIDSFKQFMQEQGIENDDIDTLGMFASTGLINPDGTPKPALQLWDQLREGN
ncbi:MAG: hypothetical protein DWQ07_02100 [Chloroflexi bacterium]|nr:MAG: hypothetical protein DWQ07_02100 [Chloroflexota bacterium]MBL1193710.1 hypothetical protein [Chloroflexota bacterium]NOH11003.1 hypothetical protein [Chloroflexota bacterium]